MPPKTRKPRRRRPAPAAAATGGVPGLLKQAATEQLIPPPAPDSPAWLVEEAVATTAIAVGYHHPSLSLQGRETVARTAVQAALATIPRLREMDGPAPLVAAQTDPRDAGGDVATGEAWTEGGAVVDPTRAVLVETAQAVLIDASTAVAGAELLTRSIGLLLAGTINGTAEQARILYIMPIDGAAEVVAEVFKLGMRSGPLINVQLSQAINRLIAPEGTPS